MTNNDVLRRIRFIFDHSDSETITIFGAAGLEVNRASVSSWMKRDSDPDFLELNDEELATFLNGLINHMRGKKEGEQPVPEKRLTNNIILRKMKIAFDLQADDILAILNEAGLNLSKHELSAFFRKREHKHYRECKDQVLRNFLQGLQARYRPDSVGKEDIH